MTTRYEKDGYVAVLVSPGFGAGWSSWASESERELMLFDPHIVDIVLQYQGRDKREMAEKINMIVALKRYESYTGGLDQLEVGWVRKGERFRITEYDGHETLETVDNIDWTIA